MIDVVEHDQVPHAVDEEEAGNEQHQDVDKTQCPKIVQWEIVSDGNKARYPKSHIESQTDNFEDDVRFDKFVVFLSDTMNHTGGEDQKEKVSQSWNEGNEHTPCSGVRRTKEDAGCNSQNADDDLERSVDEAFDLENIPDSLEILLDISLPQDQMKS